MEKAPPPSSPPRLGRYILRKIYDDNIYHEIEGDLREIFLERVETRNKTYASFQYMIDVLLSTRNYYLRRRKKVIQKNSTAMLKNYFKITLRTISKNKVYSALNIMGLAVGISAFIFILQYVSYENSYDKFHSNHEDLYRVRYKVYHGEDLNIDCAAAVPRVGPFMKEKMPEVVDYARAFPMSGVMAKDNNKFRENRIQVADPSFLKIFDFPLLHGDVENVLNKPNQVVLSESMARKYFGRTDVVGEEITCHSWLGSNLEITGVAMDVPNNSHIKFDFIISYETLNNQTTNDEGRVASEVEWGWYDFNSYVLLEPGTDPVAFDKKFAEVLYEERGKEFEERGRRAEFPLQSITDIHLYSNLLQESEPEEQGDGEAVFFLTIVAFFILIIAWVNYINLSTARSVERAKEVGVRKTMGAYRKQLIYQFLTEAIVLNFIALVIGLLIVIVGIRSFNQLTDSLLSIDFLKNSQFWLVAGGVFLAGSTLSGLYPAFVLSSFKPSSVLKGKFSGNNAGALLRKGLVVFQFAASVSLITGTFIVSQQLAHMKNVTLGFEMANTMVIKGPAVFGADSLYLSKFEAFRNDLLKNKEIESMTAGSSVPGAEIFWTNGIKRNEDGDDQWKTIYIAGIDYEYFPTFDIEILAGRNYSKSHSTDTGAVILNKAAVEFLNYESPEAAINQKVRFWGQPKTIIGVVDDYKQMSAKTAVSPIVFPLSEGERNYFTLRLKTDNYQETFDLSESTYQSFFPGNPFDYFLLDDFFNRQYNNEQTFSSVFTLFALFGIVVACLGLFGLSSFSALQRTKEIGIRKTLGANTSSILYILTKEFIILIGIANVIAWPIIYLVMNGWLDNFATRISIGIPVFIISGLLVILVALVTVGFKTLRTAKSNPIEALRYE
ncbi:MAG: ABC transporter permease [Cyclobacteriaceae bacterium]